MAGPEHMKKTVSRRDFLSTGVHSAALAYPLLLAWGLIPSAPVSALDHEGLEPVSNSNNKAPHVLILGAGLAGLTAAYELEKKGYTCTLVEASSRVGGRCFSVRKNSRHEEINAGIAVCNFSEGQYFNAGPSRIPHHHAVVLHYCKEWGVPLEVYNNINENAYFYSDPEIMAARSTGTSAIGTTGNTATAGNTATTGGSASIPKLLGKKIRIREIHNDVRGHHAELLAKAIHSNALEAPVAKEDMEKWIQWLRAEGGLDTNRLYKASARRGFSSQPGYGTQAGVLENPFTLQELLNAGLMDPEFYNVAEYTYELQQTLFQAVGGMEKIAEAVQKRIKSTVLLESEVQSFYHQEDGVTVTYKRNGKMEELKGDYCICTIPFPVLRKMDHNLSAGISRAIDFIPYISTGKMGLQFNRRFWEEDEQIYGGITHTNNALTQIFYPNNNYLGDKGVLIGYYHFNERAEAVGKMSYAERQKLALDLGKKIHPQYAAAFEQGYSIAWHQTKFQEGGWALYSEQQRASLYPALHQPSGRIYLAGEHTTHLNAWMAGAFSSARAVVAQIHQRVKS